MTFFLFTRHFHEGFGRTNIEALMNKKNVICSDIKINREILKKNVFYVKKFMSENSWTQSINKFFSKIKLKINLKMIISLKTIKISIKRNYLIFLMINCKPIFKYF